MNTSKLRSRPLDHLDYQQLRNTTDWEVLDDQHIKRALKNDLFSICIVENGKPVGMGRVVGDGSIYFYIQDVIVLPEYKGKGVGKRIMMEIERYLDKTISHYAFIGLMAADGVASFYHQFGFAKRPKEAPGMFKIIRK